MIRDKLTPATRSLELQHVIDPGFVNHRLTGTVIGESGVRLIDQIVSQLPPLPEGLQVTRIARAYTDVLLEYCKVARIKTLADLLSSGCGRMFCSTECLKPCRNVYRARRTSSVVAPAGKTQYKVVLEYSTEHIFSDTHRSRLHSGDTFSVIAALNRREDDTLVFHPLVMGAPWLIDSKDPAVEDWAMWWGREYFENFVEDFDELSTAPAAERAVRRYGERMEGSKRYTARISRRTEPSGRIHSASVTVSAAPCAGATQVVLADNVLRKLKEWFGPHFEHGRHCVWSGVAAEISTANIAGDLPQVGRTNFFIEVVEVELDSGLDWQKSGWLLTMASMDAIADYLLEFERSRT